MFVVEIYAAVQKFVFIEGHSRREAARVFGLNRETVLKMCRFSLPPGYTRTKPAAAGKAVKLGGPKWDHLAGAIGDKGRAAGIATRQARASGRATDLTPIIAALQAQSVTTLAGLAAALTERGIPTARGSSKWSPMQVSRVLARTAV